MKLYEGRNRLANLALPVCSIVAVCGGLPTGSARKSLHEKQSLYGEGRRFSLITAREHNGTELFITRIRYRLSELEIDAGAIAVQMSTPPPLSIR